MQEVSFEDALEIITLKDPRFPREAYLFVREALDHTQRCLTREREGCIRHVSGQELLAGIKDYARTQFGPMAVTVLEEWGIRSCQDFGDIVFNMVETGGCPILSIDDLTDLPSLVQSLITHADPVSRFLWDSFSEAARRKLTEEPGSNKIPEVLTKELNHVVASKTIYEDDRFSGITLPPEAKCLAEHKLSGVPLAQFNRLLLESAYPRQIAKS